MTRFALIALALSLNPTEAARADSVAREVVELDATAQLALMADGKRSSHDLVVEYLSRINALDRGGPKLNAVIELNPDALKLAQARDRERAEGRCGVLCGLPILIKDNIDVAGPMATSAGSLALSDHHARKNAPLVERLLAAGVVILGKTNLSEWANFRSSQSSSGWSSRGGQTRNPHVLDRSPCGSSSGSGAAMAARLSAATIGTETDGSIICPAAINGVVGMKPTVGWIAQAGIIPISSSQDSAGPITASVRDARLLLGVMAARKELVALANSAALRGKRFGIARQAMGFNAAVDAEFAQAVQLLRQAGAEVIDVEIPNYGKYRDAEFLLLKYEFKAGLNDYLSRTDARVAVKSLSDLIAFNQRNQARVMPWFGQETLLAANALGDLNSVKYLTASRSAKALAGAKGALKSLRDKRLDALIAPSNAPAWRIDWVNGDNYSGGDASIAAVPGYPAITVPMGFLHQLPLGISFIGGPNSDAALLQLAESFEQVRSARRMPTYRASIEQ